MIEVRRGAMCVCVVVGRQRESHVTRTIPVFPFWVLTKFIAINIEKFL